MTVCKNYMRSGSNRNVARNDKFVLAGRLSEPSLSRSTLTVYKPQSLALASLRRASDWCTSCLHTSGGLSAPVLLPASARRHASHHCLHQAVHPSLCKCNQELMSHPKGGEGAFNYVTALSKVLNCCAHVRQEGNPPCGSLGRNCMVLMKCLQAQHCTLWYVRTPASRAITPN